ncbi:unnamed protein product [Caretta caretta]
MSCSLKACPKESSLAEENNSLTRKTPKKSNRKAALKNIAPPTHPNGRPPGRTSTTYLRTCKTATEDKETVPQVKTLERYTTENTILLILQYDEEDREKTRKWSDSTSSSSA